VPRAGDAERRAASVCFVMIGSPSWLEENTPLLSNTPVIVQMQSRIRQWKETADDKALFLSCYMMMTSNMLAASNQQEFSDPGWVSKLLHRFADYYFVALQAYEHSPASAPRVWQLAHNAAADPAMAAIRKLLLGVNAHINYDLVLTLVDLLRPEWATLSASQRADRYADHCRVNDVIGRTIDAVQDQVLEPAMPVMDIIDKLLGPIDELLLSRLIAHWRETVWLNATRLLAVEDAQEQAQLVSKIEQEALRIGDFICSNANVSSSGRWQAAH